MSARTTVERLSFPTDQRGLVVEPLDANMLAGQQNVHLVITKPGCVRGNHYHERGTEMSLVIGPALVRLKEGGETRDMMIAPGEAYRFTFPPGTPHAIKNTGTEPMVIVSFNTVVHDRARPDVVRDVLIEG